MIFDTAELTPHTPLSANHREWLYNGLDCAVTFEVFQKLEEQLDPVSSRTYTFSKALQAPILEMMMRGIRVDQRQRDRVLRKTRQDIELLSNQLNRLVKEGVGVDLNWRSSQQLINLFYDVMGLKAIRKRNAAGQMRPTVNRDAIERLTQYFHAEPICNHLLKLRELDKQRSFLETGIDPDGRMRTNLSIAGTRTGRLASAMSDFGTGGNLQNVDRDLRSVFIADPGMKLCNIDLEQADARNVGAICWNTFVLSHGESFAGAYLDACESGDLHTRVCQMAWTQLDWSGEPRRVADQIAYRGLSYRDLAKKLGHGTNYFGLPPTMARHTKVERSLIEDFQRQYFTAFPAIGTYDKADHRSDNWHNRVRRALKESSQLTTLLGRRRYFFGRHNDDETLREAIAYEPQSLTADEIDIGLLKLWRANRVQLLMQVHDSILLQFPEELEEEIVPWAVEQLVLKMELAKGREFYVPTEAKVGWNWGDFSEKNPGGLIKWKGGDDRKRAEEPELSIWEL